MLKKDSRVEGVHSMDTLLELFLDIYHLAVIKNERPPFVLLGLLAMAGWLVEKGQENVQP